jgi:hypothetical protein
MAPYGSSPVQVQSVSLNVEPATTARRTTVGSYSSKRGAAVAYQEVGSKLRGTTCIYTEKTQTLHLRGRHSEINKHNLFPVLQNSL